MFNWLRKAFGLVPVSRNQVWDRKYPLTRANARHAPAHAEYYLLYDGDEVIYIDTCEGGRMRNALRTILDGTSNDCARGATHYSGHYAYGTWDPSGDRQRFLHGFKDGTGRLPRCHEPGDLWDEELTAAHPSWSPPHVDGRPVLDTVRRDRED